MDTLRIDICYRPLRLGWAIRAGDFDALRQVFRLSHTVWGGRFNPILVVDDADQARDLVDLFRVDVVWPVGDTEQVNEFPKRFPHLIKPFFEKSLFVGDVRGGRRAQLLDIHNALVTLGDGSDAKAMRDQGFRIYSWNNQDPLADLFLAQLGAYPNSNDIGIDYRAMVSQVLKPVEAALVGNAPIPADVVEHPTLSYLSRHKLRRHYSIQAGWDSPGFYVGSVADFSDLVTYWNLRAADIPLWFVDPEHLDRFTDVIPAWEKYTGEVVARFPEHRQHSAVWTRREDAQTVLQPFGGRINTLCVMREHSWSGGGVRAPMMHFGEAHALGTVDRSGRQPHVSFQLSDKPFDGNVWFHTQHLVASISTGVGLNDDQFTLSPPYVPELNEFLSRAMHFDYKILRVEPERIGLVIDAADTDESLGALVVSDLFQRIFDLAGFSAEPSNAGLIARQLITRLGDLQGGRAFKIPGVRRLLRTYGPNASFTKSGALQIIGKPDPENPRGSFSDDEHLYMHGEKVTPAGVFAYLGEKGLFRIGADLTCPVCRLPSWLPLDVLQQRNVCSLCGSEYDATRQLLGEKWAYRRSGVMGLEKNNQGAVPVVLTLQQLDTNLGSSLDGHLYSPSLNLTPKDGSPPLEVDFVWMVTRQSERRTVVILGECKDQMDDAIDENDIRNLRRAAEALPRSRFEAFLLLAKLAPFSPEEVALARTLNDGLRPRVIMLTARELEPYHLFERTKKEFNIHEYASSAEDLAQVTTQIYFREPITGG
jgi:hypothetical protein